MEKTALSKALFIAGVAAISSMPALAEKPTSDFEFHGYFRAGALTSAKNDFKQHEWGGQKETLGRLGLEADDFWELAFMQRWDWEKSEDSDGKSVRINARLGQDNPNGNGSNLFANIDGKAAGLIESFVEFDGVSNTGTLWGGQRYYGRDNYIFMTDFFYTDYSGTGIGLKGTELAGGKWDFAYIASNQSLGLNEMLNAFHVRADYGQWRIEGMAKQMGENVNGDEFSTSGFEGHVQYSPSNFFGFGNGFSKIGVQYGQGLGGSTMLGRTFTNYNQFSPGGAGFNPDAVVGQTNMTRVKDGDQTVRAQAYGGYIGENWLFFPAVGYEQTSYDDNVDDFSYWYAMVRPVYTMPSIDDFAIAAEFGYTDNSVNRDNGGNATYKATIAPTWTVGTGFGPAPEIRLLATYLKGNPGVSSNAGEDDHDFIVGVQVDMWW